MCVSHTEKPLLLSYSNTTRSGLSRLNANSKFAIPGGYQVIQSGVLLQIFHIETSHGTELRSSWKRTAHEQFIIRPLLRLGTQVGIKVGVVGLRYGLRVRAHAVKIGDCLVWREAERGESLRGSRGAVVLLVVFMTVLNQGSHTLERRL